MRQRHSLTLFNTSSLTKSVTHSECFRIVNWFFFNLKILIALGHSGYKIEKQIAELVPHLDAVVGGHSHTFLFTPLDDQVNYWFLVDA